MTAEEKLLRENLDLDEGARPCILASCARADEYEAVTVSDGWGTP